MNKTSFVALGCLLSPIVVFGQLRYNLVIQKVPTGELSRIVDDVTTLSLPATHISNVTTKTSMSGSAASYFDFAAQASIRDVVSSSGSNSAGIGLFVDDSLTINGSNTGADATVVFEFEVSGVFKLEGGRIKAGADPLFGGFCNLLSRTDSSRALTLREAEYSLDDSFSRVSTERVLSGTYPFTVRMEMIAFIVVGEAFDIDTDFTAGVDVTFGEFDGPTPELNSFGKSAELDSLSLAANGKICRIRVRNNSILNPTISSSTGTDYSSLLLSPEHLKVTKFEVDPTTRKLVLEWVAPDHMVNFQIRSSSNLNTPPANWPSLSTGLARTPCANRFETILANTLDPRSFFVVQDQSP